MRRVCYYLRMHYSRVCISCGLVNGNGVYSVRNVLLFTYVLHIYIVGM